MYIVYTSYYANLIKESKILEWLVLSGRSKENGPVEHLNLGPTYTPSLRTYY